MFRHLLKVLALSIAGLVLYLALYDPKLGEQDRVLMIFGSIFFFALFIGSFFSAKYVEFPLGVVFILNFIQGAVTGKIISIFRRHHGTIDINTEPSVYWLGMFICLVAGTWCIVHAYRLHKKETANKTLNPDAQKQRAG